MPYIKYTSNDIPNVKYTSYPIPDIGDLFATDVECNIINKVIKGFLDHIEYYRISDLGFGQTIDQKYQYLTPDQMDIIINKINAIIEVKGWKADNNLGQYHINISPKR